MMIYQILMEEGSHLAHNIATGDFNNDGFTIHLDDVGDHDYVFV